MPTDRETYIAALAEDILSLSLPRDLPVQITAHGFLTEAQGFSIKRGYLPASIPDVPVMYVNALGVAMAAAELPIRGGMLGAVTVMKRGEAGQVRSLTSILHACCVHTGASLFHLYHCLISMRLKLYESIVYARSNCIKGFA
jgi:hypothetical protein